MIISSLSSESSQATLDHTYFMVNLAAVYGDWKRCLLVQLWIDSSAGGTPAPAPAEKKETDFFAEHTQVCGAAGGLS